MKHETNCLRSAVMKIKSINYVTEISKFFLLCRDFFPSERSTRETFIQPDFLFASMSCRKRVKQNKRQCQKFYTLIYEFESSALNLVLLFKHERGKRESILRLQRELLRMFLWTPRLVRVFKEKGIPQSSRGLCSHFEFILRNTFHRCWNPPTARTIIKLSSKIIFKLQRAQLWTWTWLEKIIIPLSGGHLNFIRSTTNVERGWKQHAMEQLRCSHNSFIFMIITIISFRFVHFAFTI